MKSLLRRQFLSKTALSVCGLALASRLAPSAQGAKAATPAFISPATSDGYSLPDLPYAFDALEPHIDAQTMQIHHGKHHAGYTRNLNAALAKLPAGSSHDLTTLFAELSKIDPALQTTLRNNGGGYYNHCLFWDTMTPTKQSRPTGALAKAIDSDLGGFAALKDSLSKAAATRFGSGWAWLLVTPSGKLAVSSTPNQDNPLMSGIVDTPGTPILGLDVWEHAYYLHYQNRRGDYVAAWFHLVDWQKVAALYKEAA